jgi:hypothetical protein
MLEAKRIWRTTQTPDVVVSLGTGYEASDAKSSRFRNFLLDGFAPRSFRSWMESIVGKNTWDDFESRIPEGSRGNYFRFDPSLPAPLPAMDDTDCMDQLSRRVRISQDWEGYRSATRALLISCLYFQLECEPEYQAGQYCCVGTIHSRIPARPLIRQLFLMDVGRPTFYKDNLNLGIVLSFDNICVVCENFSLAVRFFVQRLEELITLSLRIGPFSRPLSNFPNSMKWFLEEQRLDCPFGPRTPSIGCAKCRRLGYNYGKKRRYMEI